MKRRIFLPREIAIRIISRGKFVMPIFILAWFFIFGAIIFCSFFIGKISQAGYSLDLDYACPSSTGGFGRDYVFHKFKPKANTIRGFIAQKSGSTQWYLCKGTLDTDNLLNNKNCENSTIAFQGMMEGEPIGGNYYKFILPRSHTLEIGADYYFQTGGILYCFHYHNEHAVAMCGIQADGSSPHCAFNDQNGFNGAGIKTITAIEEPALDPVILVPGIMGSWEVEGEWKLDPILHTYDNLWQALKNAGYEEGKTLFAFPYEWRQDNTLSAYQLKQKIDEVKQISQSDKVDLVAHSMGGLVARAYAESDYYGGDIDQLVFLGTPHRGAPKSYLTWEGGEIGDQQNELFDLLQKEIFEFEAHNRGYNSLFDYVQNYVKSTEQLLPDYGYLQDAGQTNFRIYDRINYPNNYPYNTFIENINLVDKINQLNNSGIKTENFIGDTGDNTINAIKVSSEEQYLPMWRHGYAEDSIKLAGDGTVPEVSSSLFASIKISNAKHSYLPTKAQTQILEFLTGSLPSEEVTTFKFPSMLLVVRIFSPADFVVIAPDGQRLGKDFLSGQAVSEIPGAFYSGFNTDEEFAVIPEPLDGEYRVELQGTGEGEYKLSASLIDDSRKINKEFTGDITIGTQREFNITYSGSSENPISELEPIDTTPPEIAINAPTAGAKYSHSANLAIDYSITDDFSGIASTTITLDGQAVATTTVDLFDYSLGEHRLEIFAFDKAGNFTQAKVVFEVVANIESTISDIEEIHNRGWLKGRLYKPLLVSVFRLLKIEARYFEREQELLEKLIKKTSEDSKLSPKQKQKLIEQYNKKLIQLKKNRAKAIDHSLDVITKLLNQAKKQKQINQAGYDIIMSDINYLRINL